MTHWIARCITVLERWLTLDAHRPSATMRQTPAIREAEYDAYIRSNVGDGRR